MHFSAYEKDGVGQPIFQMIGVTSLVVGHAMFIALILLLPTAYMSDDSSGSLKAPLRELAAFMDGRPRRLAFLLCAYCILAIWAVWASISDRFSQATAIAGPSHEAAAVGAAILEILLLAVFTSRCVAVAAHPSHERGLRLFFTRILYYFVPFFGLSILTLLMHVVCRPWSRMLAMMGVLSVAVSMSAFTGMAWILWPSPNNWVLLDGKAAKEKDIVHFPKILSIISRPVQVKVDPSFEDMETNVFGMPDRGEYDEIPSLSTWPTGQSAQESGERSIQMESF